MTGRQDIFMRFILIIYHWVYLFIFYLKEFEQKLYTFY